LGLVLPLANTHGMREHLRLIYCNRATLLKRMKRTTESEQDFILAKTLVQQDLNNQAKQGK